MLISTIRWIKTEDRLPLENKPVIIYTPVEEIRHQNARLIGKMFFGYGRTYKLHEVLCWRYESEIERPKEVDKDDG